MNALSPQTMAMMIDCWKAQVEVNEVVASPASLTLALGLDNITELEELREQDEFRSVIEKAYTWMAADWYKQLRKSSKEVNAQAIIYALKTMGYSDNAKVVKSKKAFNIVVEQAHTNL